MSEIIDVSALSKSVISALSAVVNGAIPELKDFAKKQLDGLARQTALIARGIVDGWIDTEDERIQWATTLRSMALEFAKTMRALIVVTIEKALHAIVGALKTAIQGAVGIALPI